MHESSSFGPPPVNGELSALGHGPVAQATTVRVSPPEATATASARQLPVERRAAPRRRKQLPALIADIDGLQGSHRAWIMDRSLGGLCVAVDNPVEQGTPLRVRAASAPTGMPWVAVTVRHCRVKGDTWELGCQFVRIPSWDVLLQFG